MMAHSCPDCGQACYCGGDIDDAFDVDDSADHCTHQCDEREEDDFEYDHGSDDAGGIERTYLCCGRTIEDGHADYCHERISDEFLERDKKAL